MVQKVYCKYARSQRFIKDIPGHKKCSGLTLTRKHQSYKLIDREGEQLAAAAATYPGRLLTQKMLEQGLDAPVTYIDADINSYTARRVTKETKKEQNVQKKKNKQHQYTQQLLFQQQPMKYKKVVKRRKRIDTFSDDDELLMMKKMMCLY